MSAWHVVCLSFSFGFPWTTPLTYCNRLVGSERQRKQKEGPSWSSLGGGYPTPECQCLTLRRLTLGRSTARGWLARPLLVVSHPETTQDSGLKRRSSRAEKRRGQERSHAAGARRPHKASNVPSKNEKSLVVSLRDALYTNGTLASVVPEESLASLPVFTRDGCRLEHPAGTVRASLSPTGWLVSAEDCGGELLAEVGSQPTCQVPGAVAAFVSLLDFRAEALGL